MGASDVAGKTRRRPTARDHLMRAAATACAEHGDSAHLEDIARAAGVAESTLHRHFPTRAALFEAAYLAQVDSICARATDLAAGNSPGRALTQWLRDFLGHVAARRGLAVALTASTGRDNPVFASGQAALREATGVLLTNAQLAGVVRSDVTAGDLLRLAQGVAVAGAQAPDDAERLLTLLVAGLRDRD